VAEHLWVLVAADFFHLGFVLQLCKYLYIYGSQTLINIPPRKGQTKVKGLNAAIVYMKIVINLQWNNV
jgi:hypothetical protein